MFPCDGAAIAVVGLTGMFKGFGAPALLSSSGRKSSVQPGSSLSLPRWYQSIVLMAPLWVSVVWSRNKSNVLGLPQ